VFFMASVYQIITDRIIESLNKGTIPWVSPYTGKSHQNYISKHVYVGINALLLNMFAINNKYSSPFWLTYNQAKQKGWRIKSGAKSAIVTFWKTYSSASSPTNQDIEEVTIGEENTENKTDKQKTAFVLRYHKIFNINEVEGCDVKETDSTDHVVSSDNTTLLDNYCKNQHIVVKNSINGVSSYAPATDVITLAPVKADFFLPVFAHECVHSTGNTKRLNRFGSELFVEKSEYSFEELIAEIGSAMLCSQMGAEFSLENSASYINGWASFLRQDKKTAIVRASSQAQKAVEFILSAAAQQKAAENV
jgi:antirestriction protein ArdC